jgi:hypothetical protein
MFKKNNKADDYQNLGEEMNRKRSGWRFSNLPELPALAGRA